jgi:hypothetical protein
MCALHAATAVGGTSKYAYPYHVSRIAYYVSGYYAWAMSAAEYKEHLSEAALQQEAMLLRSQPTGFCTHHAPVVTVLARC